MCLQYKSFENTVEKLLVMTNFSFSHSVFYPFGELYDIFIKFEIVVCKLFQFGRVKNLSFGKGLNKLCLWNTNAPKRPFFRKQWPWYLTLNLVPPKRSCHKYTHVKYEGINSNQSKDMANVQSFCWQTARQTDRWTDRPKTICPRSIDSGAKKTPLFTKLQKIEDSRFSSK